MVLPSTPYLHFNFRLTLCSNIAAMSAFYILEQSDEKEYKYEI